MNSKTPVWPDYLMIRDTGLNDDLGGLGQRIYTTAGAGYEKRKYVREDLAHPTLLSRLDALRAGLERLASECAECGGKGYVYEGEAITGRGPDDVFPEKAGCVECADIRALLEQP